MKEVCVECLPKIDEDAGDTDAFLAGYNMVVDRYGEMEEFMIQRDEWESVNYEISDDDDPNYQGESGTLESGWYRLNGDRLERRCKRKGWRDYEEFLKEEEAREAMN